MFSIPSYGEWKEFDMDINGKTFYLDYDRIKKVDGFFYIWILVDFPKPDRDGDLSVITYRMVDCKLFRDKDLHIRGYKKLMGKGNWVEYKPETPNWESPFPNTINESILNSICNR